MSLIKSHHSPQVLFSALHVSHLICLLFFGWFFVLQTNDFSAFRGKDSRFVLEQNIGPIIAGDQETGYLYKQTNELCDRGVKLTYSGDNPFLYRLVIGCDSDQSKKFPSDLALYVGENPDYLPFTTHKTTGRRLDVEVPFRVDLPKVSLVFFDDIRCIFPDVVHMTTRLVEHDIQFMAQKICKDKAPYHSFFLQKLENNLAKREVKRQFQFKVENQTTVGPLSLSGTHATNAIADKEEFLGRDDIPDLYENVWKETEVVDKSDHPASINSHRVLKEMFLICLFM